MKSLVFFVATVALASAIVQKQETVTLRCQSGRQLTISQQTGPLGVLEIEIAGPRTIPQRIQINENNQIIGASGNLETSILTSQAVLLAKILDVYPGIDETTCEILVNEVQQTIQMGQATNGLRLSLQVLERELMGQNIVPTSSLNQLQIQGSGRQIMSPAGMTLVRNLPITQRSMVMWPMNQQVAGTMNDVNTIASMTPNHLMNVLYGQQQLGLQRMMV